MERTNNQFPTPTRRYPRREEAGTNGSPEAEGYVLQSQGAAVIPASPSARVDPGTQDSSEAEGHVPQSQESSHTTPTRRSQRREEAGSSDSSEAEGYVLQSRRTAAGMPASLSSREEPRTRDSSEANGYVPVSQRSTPDSTRRPAVTQQGHVQDRTLKVVQINLHHCKLASINIMEQATNGGQHITLIQEPYCPFGRVTGVPPGTTLHVGAVGRRIRSCVITATSIGAWTLHQFSDEDMVTVGVVVNIHGRQELLFLASVYMPYDSSTPPPSQKLHDLVEFCRRKGGRLIIGSDTNAHHTHWGSTDVNNRGEALFEFAMRTDLMVCNQGNRPTFVTQNRSEVLDVTFANLAAHAMITNWKVLDRESFSDHRQIAFRINCDFPKVAVRYRNVRKTDWNRYLEILQHNVDRMGDDPPTNVEEVEVLAVNVEQAISNAFEQSCKLITLRD